MAGKNRKIVVILGLTATGKSDLAVKLAKRFGGEVISADSRQVYKGLDIATGKITKKEMRGVPHHLLSVASPKRNFSAADYKKLAEKKIEEILARRKLPIICGGTGFYISALLGEIELANVPPNKSLRKRLLGSPASKLFSMLKKLDPKRAKTIDAKNPVRLIRAIEIAKAGPAQAKPARALNSLSYKIVKIGLNLPEKELKERIHLRTLKRLKQGMIAEAKRLHKQGLSYRKMGELGMEYRLLAEYLNNKITKEQLIEGIEKENWHYAKRQMRWFKRDKEIRWVKSTNVLFFRNFTD